MRIQRWLSLAVAVAALAVGSTKPLAAQGTTTGAITGSVTDEKNAPAPNVSVEVVNRANGAKANQITRDNGRFFIPNLASRLPDEGAGHAARRRSHGSGDHDL